MKITLTHAPLDDPTVPYHSNAYLAGHLKSMGFEDVSIRDLNAEFVNWCFEPAVIEFFGAEVDRRIEALERKNTLDFSEQEEYYGLWTAQKVSVEGLTHAVAGLRQMDTFLDWEAYCRCVKTLNAYFALLSALSYPCEIHNFRTTTHGAFSIYNKEDLFDEQLLDKLCYPLHGFLERLAEDEQLAASDLIGVSVVYDHQMLYAVRLLRFMRKTWPNKRIIIGGTAISGYYKNLKNPEFLEMFLTLCDGIVVGEGETALQQIAACGGEWQDRNIRNFIYRDQHTGQMVKPKAVYFEKVPELGKPDYDYNWSLYLSPGRLINYSPTRGCYWNRCTFCDYGLNVDKPTSPWRETPIEKVIEELKAACTQQRVNYVYFAVDVMAPGYLERLADAIIEAGLDIRWSAEVRMEKIFTPKRCERLAQSGAVCISFGMESGNQRVLDLIDKGTKVEYMQDTMRNFSAAGVAVQLMAFTHFPSETEQERSETRAFIKKNEPFWATGGLDKFVLTGKAIVARNPDKFGIDLMEVKDLDTEVYVAYKIDDQVHQRSFEGMKGLEELEGDEDIWPLTLTRPWAGSTDTLHSMIFYQTYGRHFFKEHPAQLNPQEEEQGTIKKTPFDIQAITQNRKRFRAYVKALRSRPSEPTYRSYRSWVDEQEPLARQTSAVYWVSYEARSVSFVKSVHKLSSHLTAGLQQ